MELPTRTARSATPRTIAGWFAATAARFALDQDPALDQGTILGEGTLALRAYDVKVSDGMIYVSRRPHHDVYGRWDDDVPAGERHAAEDSAPG
jgi:hypothetical protein